MYQAGWVALSDSQLTWCSLDLMSVFNLRSDLCHGEVKQAVVDERSCSILNCLVGITCRD